MGPACRERAAVHPYLIILYTLPDVGHKNAAPPSFAVQTQWRGIEGGTNVWYNGLGAAQNALWAGRYNTRKAQVNVNAGQGALFQRRPSSKNCPFPTALRKMIVPAVISQLIVLIYNMADTFFVGQTGNPYMVAGTSLILPCVQHHAVPGRGWLASGRAVR